MKDIAVKRQNFFKEMGKDVLLIKDFLYFFYSVYCETC